MIKDLGVGSWELGGKNEIKNKKNESDSEYISYNTIQYIQRERIVPVSVPLLYRTISDEGAGGLVALK